MNSIWKDTAKREYFEALKGNKSTDVGVLKQDSHFRHFSTRGKCNLETQFFLLSIAFHIKKLCNRLESSRLGQALFLLKAYAA